MTTNLVIIAALTLLVGAGAGFAGGVKYQENKQPTFGTNGNFMMRAGTRTGATNNGNGNRMMGGFRPLDGEIIATGDSTITVKLADGSSKIVMLSQTTAINKADTAAAADLKTGAKVAVFGQTNTDGSVSAQNIQINPVLRVRTQ